MAIANLSRTYEPETTLFPEEVDVILEMMVDILSFYAPGAGQGTFILDGQKYGDEAQCILRFNLPGGPYEYRPSGHFSRTDTDLLAAESIDQLLAIPGASLYISGDNEAELRASIETARDVKSGIWCKEDLCVLVLNATHGRFLASCLVEDAEHADTDGALDRRAIYMTLYALAYTIAKLCPEDAALQDSVRHIADDAPAIAREENASAEYYVRTKFFGNCTAPALQAWRSWLDTKKGELTLFFE